MTNNKCEKLAPCKNRCCSFQNSKKQIFVRLDWIPRWSDKAMSECGVHLMYRTKLPGLKTEADWINLPDRESLLEFYENKLYDSTSLEACLNPLRFDPTTGLGEAHEWIRRYLFHRHDWYRLSIYAGCTKSFLEAMKEVPLVILPYGCISNDSITISNEEHSLQTHKRHMIVVVKNDNVETFQRAMEKTRLGMKTYLTDYKFKLMYHRINTLDQLIYNIADLSEPSLMVDYNDRYPNKHYVIFNPTVDDAMWWMFLLSPYKDLDSYVRCNISSSKIKKFEKRDCKEVFNAATELKFKNCVVRFDPLNQRIGEPILNLKDHIAKNRPFVYWLRGQVLDVTEMHDVPFRITCCKESRQPFVEWCISNQTNTVLNLNDDSWVCKHVDDCDKYNDETCICEEEYDSNDSDTENNAQSNFDYNRLDKYLTFMTIDDNEQEWLLARHLQTKQQQTS